MRRFISIICIAALLLSSHALAHNVLWKPKATDLNSLRIYLDRDGNIYPLLGPAIDSVSFRTRTRHEDDVAKLSVYYQRWPADLATVCEKYGVPVSFPALQQQLTKSYLEVLADTLTHHPELVVLIHGFNNDEGQEVRNDYDALKRRIRRVTGREFTFLEVFWDGLAGNPMGVWKRGEPNSVWAGLALRRLLNNVQGASKMYILTHSLGASVGTQSLFNVLKWPDSDFQTMIDSQAEHINTPAMPIVLGMLAPAIPGQNTFDEVDKQVPAGCGALQKIVVGYNIHDYATSKQIGPIRAPKIFGATSLCSVRSEVRRTGDTVKVHCASIQYCTVDFSRDEHPRIHAIADYMRMKHFDAFIKAVFDVNCPAE